MVSGSFGPPLEVMFPSFSLPLDVLWRPNLQQMPTEAQLAQDNLADFAAAKEGVLVEKI